MPRAESSCTFASVWNYSRMHARWKGGKEGKSKHLQAETHRTALPRRGEHFLFQAFVCIGVFSQHIM